MTPARQKKAVRGATALARATVTALAVGLVAVPAGAQEAQPAAPMPNPAPVAAKPVSPKVVASPKPVVPKPAAVAATPAPIAPTPAPAALPAAQTAPEPVVPAPVVAPVAPKATPAKSWLRDSGKQTETKSAEAPPAAPGSGSSLRIASLFALVAVLAGGAIFLKRRRKGALRAVSSELSVITAARVGSKADVVVVDISGRRLLLGVTEAQVTRLCWLDGDPDSEEPVEFRASAASLTSAVGRAPAQTGHKPAGVARAGAPARSFRETLLGALGQKPAAEDAAVAIAAATEDVVTRTPRAPVAAPAGAPEMVDVEGQARGLVLRLQKRV